jgi:DNA-binding winged helix-turn-helix (wHTH) protein/tetratricopeptide (TPR) repeat protein
LTGSRPHVTDISKSLSERKGRRGLEPREDLYAFGAFQLDTRRRRLSRDGAPLTLTPTAIEVLVHLVRNAGRVVTKDELLGAVWPGRVVEEANVKQAVFTLRKAFGAEGGGLIATVPGRGYRFTADVRSQSAEAAASAAAPSPPGRVSGRWRVGALLALAAIAVASLIAWQWRRHPAASPGRTVVLADFDNRTGDAVFDRTLTNLLRVDLSQSPFLNVVSEKQARQTLTLMTKPEDQPVTPALAEEICARNNGDAVVQGAIAALGARYLVTLTATDCSGVETIATGKEEVTGREAVAPAIDRLIADVRARLGESRRSITRFNVPLVSEQTASLDALEAYSEAKWLFDHGRLAEAIPLDRRAIDLDPRFSAAYANLGVIYVALYDERRSIENFSRAYALRGTANEREKLRITALYDQFATKDYGQAILNYQVWTEIYPQDAIGWSNLANAEDYIGRHAQAVVDGRRALTLRPRLENPYVVLARAELASGDARAGWATAQQAVAQGLAGDPTHRELLRIADARGDAAGVSREAAWGRSTATALRTQEATGEIALSQGRVREATAIFGRISQALAARGTYDYMRPATARMLAEIGLDDRAAAMVRYSDPNAETDPDYLYVLAAVGDADRARRLLTAWLRSSPADTLANAVYGPETQAAMALRQGDAARALAALRPTLPFAARAPDIDYLWGSAYLAAHDGARAAAAFRAILAHRGWSPESPLYPLARLGLARALTIDHAPAAAVIAYRDVLETWKTADPDLPLLKQVEDEYRQAQNAAAAPR